MIEFTGINKIGNDAYFIRLSDKKDFFLHSDKSLENDENVGFRIVRGLVGAGVWHKDQADKLIKLIGNGNLEIVKVRDVVGNDYSGN